MELVLYHIGHSLWVILKPFLDPRHHLSFTLYVVLFLHFDSVLRMIHWRIDG